MKWRGSEGALQMTLDRRTSTSRFSANCMDGGGGGGGGRVNSRGNPPCGRGNPLLQWSAVLLAFSFNGFSSQTPPFCFQFLLFFFLFSFLSFASISWHESRFSREGSSAVGYSWLEKYSWLPPLLKPSLFPPLPCCSSSHLLLPPPASSSVRLTKPACLCLSLSYLCDIDSKVAVVLTAVKYFRPHLGGGVPRGMEWGFPSNMHAWFKLSFTDGCASWRQGRMIWTLRVLPSNLFPSWLQAAAEHRWADPCKLCRYSKAAKKPHLSTPYRPSIINAWPVLETAALI